MKELRRNHFRRKTIYSLGDEFMNFEPLLRQYVRNLKTCWFFSLSEKTSPTKKPIYWRGKDVACERRTFVITDSSFQFPVALSRRTLTYESLVGWQKARKLHWKTFGHYKNEEFSFSM